MIFSEKMSYYIDLELSTNASDEEIKRSYRKLSLKYHPDKNPEGSEQFVKINKAFNVLSNQHHRVIYDHTNFHQYLIIKEALLAVDPSVYMTFFSIFGDQITSNYSKREMFQDLMKKDLDKITAIVLKSYHDKDPVFAKYYIRIAGVLICLKIGLMIWDIGKFLLKWSVLGVVTYYVGWKRILF